MSTSKRSFQCNQGSSTTRFSIMDSAHRLLSEEILHLNNKGGWMHNTTWTRHDNEWDNPKHYWYNHYWYFVLCVDVLNFDFFISLREIVFILATSSIYLFPSFIYLIHSINIIYIYFMHCSVCLSLSLFIFSEIFSLLQRDIRIIQQTKQTKLN